ncbi:hypothetical protein DV706_14045 [Natronorubrum bangense]|uniref:Uncharacterized protein n=3 Tax=Natronorubrum bangense TaxID=61858 RepID=L9WKW4_9EURY|nr:hypothetical protein C494_07670 [Natronorubrum bangense JCM 10635]QCC55490.1 hypothetical protein DV706_14045 [Natronorubrum bangense]
MDKYGLEEQPEHSLSSAIQELDPVEIAPLFVGNPYDPEGQPIPISFSNATINPDTAIDLARRSMSGEQLSEDDGDFMSYATHSDGYAAVPHYEFFFPMAKALLDADIRDVSGEFRCYDNGAQVHGEVMFQDAESQLNLPDDRDPLFVGLSVGNSYDGTCAMYAQGYAMDTTCTNSMRSLTDRKSRKHIGEPSEVAEWWDEVLIQMTALRDILGEIIEEALEVEVDFLNQPYDPEEFYEHLGLPSYLARAAATTARNRSPQEGGTRTVMSFWTLHSGLTSALTHDFNGTSEVGSIETYSQIAKELLFNPQRMIGEVKSSYERQQRQDEAVDERTLEQNIAMIEQYEVTLDDRKEEFEEFENHMNGLLTNPAEN